MKDLPSEEAMIYGDRNFGLMMMAKVISVQLVVDLGYHVLFQDVGKINVCSAMLMKISPRECIE